MLDDLKISPMSMADLRMVLAWAEVEGWNPGVADASAFHAADPEGFFLARIGADPIAAISVVNHDPRNAFLGLYICREDMRGKGIGLATWTHGLEHAGKRSVGLDGVPEQEANYAASGFVKTGSSLRHVGRWEARTSDAVRAFQTNDLTSLLKLDRAATGYARTSYMTAWFTPEARLRSTLVLVQDGEITGSATWRRCCEGTKIGPIFAPDLAGALDLIGAVATERPNGPLIVDVPEANAELCRALEGAGFEIPFATARMYRGAVPEGGHGLQAITTMELG